MQRNPEPYLRTRTLRVESWYGKDLTLRLVPLDQEVQLICLEGSKRCFEGFVSPMTRKYDHNIHFTWYGVGHEIYTCITEWIDFEEQLSSAS